MFKKCSCLQWVAMLIVGLLIVCSLSAYLGVSMTHEVFVPIDAPKLANIREVSMEQPGVVSCTVTKGGLLISALGEGVTGITYGDELLAVAECRGHGFVMETISGRYTGAVWVQCAVLVFLAGAAVILGIALYRQMKTAFYHYATPLLAAFLLLTVLILVLVVFTCVMFYRNTMENILSQVPVSLLMITLPIMILFALAMLISNLSLLRHEGRTWRNLLGAIIGLALSFAALAIMFNIDVSGSLEQLHFHDFLVNLFSGMVLWTVCKLAGIILCGVVAAKHQPNMDKDYILILGCKLSRKGGLTPLLRGRVDRALNFARQQQAATGHMPVLIPCGGKGSDELRSEAAAMQEYLLEQGVPEEGILPEDRSANTWENIRNAQKMMKPGAKVAYSTTNYHVFRAGVWASRNGLMADGMGSKTKWYYWPNAFMREYVALIAANLPHELVMIVLIGIQSGLLAYLYH